MSNDLKVFENAEFGKLTIVEKDGEPWFIAKEISDILGYSEASAMARKLDDDEKTTLPFSQSDSNYQTNKTVINESGFYSAVLGSKRPEARKFKKWVTSEVLPAIRKTGGYMVEIPDETPEELMARVLIMAQDTLKRRDERLKQLETKIELDAPKVEFADTVMEAETDIPIGMVAKFLGVGRNTFFEILRNEGILCKTGRTKNVANQPYIDRGYFTVTEKPIEMNDVIILKFVTLVTPKGQDWLIRKFKYLEG